MEQELRTIYEAQKIDKTITENERKMVLAPKKIEEMEDELRQMRDRISQETEILEELDKERRKKEKELDAEKEKIKKYESRLFEVKTNKEYQALLKEIEAAKQLIDKEEEEILIIMEKVEELKKDFMITSKRLQERGREVEKETRMLQEEMGVMDKKLMEFREARNNLLAAVSDNLRGTYNMLIEKRNGLAVTNVKNGVCLGCFVSIPPQLFIEVTKNSKLILCPSCNRIFYFMEEGEK